MTIYLLRHGQTTWNTQGRKQGQGDAPLTPLGIQQAQGVAKGLSALLDEHNGPLLLHVSPLERAQATAGFVSKALKRNISRSNPRALMEINYGSWEGLTNEDVDERFPGERKRRNRDRWHYHFDGGESYAIVDQRVAQWFATLDMNATHVVITHDMISRLIRGRYLGLAPEAILALRHPHDHILKLAEGCVTTCTQAMNTDRWIAT